METREKSSPFVLEFYTLGEFAKQAVKGLQCIYLYDAQQGKDGFFVDPASIQIPQTVQKALKRQAQQADEPAMEQENCLTRQLTLPEAGCLGSICFEGAQPWTTEQLPLLESIATIYAYALRAERDRGEATLQQWVWNQMMDSTRACIYVTDTQTDEILFMNRSMKQAFGLTEAEGQVCWKVLQKNQQGRCDFCPVDMLLEDVNACYTWEEHNSVTGRIYENYDSLMPWMDGRMVHFQHSTDVTEARRMYKAAMVDELTGVLSRRAGKERLMAMLEKYASSQRVLCVCMLDLNDLKSVNDLYGHAAGDVLLTQVASCLRRVLQGSDFIMRLSGDEFVAAIADVSQTEAAARMQQALEYFDQERPEFYPVGDAFCYGIVEVRERIPMRDILSQVDERMYQQKRTLHIRRAEALLNYHQTDGAQPERFAYDASRLYDALVASTDAYVYVCNMKTGVFRYPPAMVAEFGLPGEVVPNAAAVWGEKVHPHDKRAFLESNQEIVDGRTDVHCVEYRAKNVRGEWLWLRCRGRLVRDEHGEAVLFAGFISNLGKTNRVDPLTGLFNKFEAESEVSQALSSNPSNCLTFIMLGIDGLKQINSLYDRVFGDEVLRITAQRLRSLLPLNANIYRMDGDEFAIIMRGNSHIAAEQLFRQIRDSFDTQQTFDGKKFYATLSCGCAYAPEDAGNYAQLTRCATYALEYAKARGKNRLEHYTDKIVLGRRRALELTQLLRESVEQDYRGFEIYYQPLFSATRKLVGAEALARWSCEKYAMVGPNEFIPLLEQSGLILPVGRWIFEQALKTCRQWEQRVPDFNMGVNLSYLQLEDESFYDYMLDVVNKTQVDPKHVILELTESYLATNMEQVTKRLNSIRSSGIRVAMDDFGTGYSSLGVLKQAPIDIAKIDRTFVKGIQGGTFDSVFLHMVVKLCSVRGVFTCLEGVETEDEFDAVRPMSLDYIQGFLLGRPIPKEEFEQLYFTQD